MKLVHEAYVLILDHYCLLLKVRVGSNVYAMRTSGVGKIIEGYEGLTFYY